MRKLICILFFYLIVSFTLKAQDTIYRINGEMMLVEMMQISGDSLQFRQDGKVIKMSTTAFSKVKYAGGNTSLFSDSSKEKESAKPIVLAGFPDAPIRSELYVYKMYNQELNYKEVDKILSVQENHNIKKKYLKIENTKASRTLFLGVFILGAAFPISYLIKNPNSANYNFTNKANSNSRFVYTGLWAISGIITIGLHNAVYQRRRDAIDLYNNTFYPYYKKR